MKTGVAISWAGLLFSGLIGACTSSVSDHENLARGSERLDSGGDVEIFSWWTSGGEKEALKALIDEHEKRVPESDVKNAAVENSERARSELSLRFQEGFPPDTFQANSGADLISWIEANGRDASDSRVESLQDMADALGWEGVFDPDVLESVSYDGIIYAVPVNVHRINSLFYRKDLFEKYSLKVPSSIQELNELCVEIAESDEIQGDSDDRVTCLGIGNKWDWTFSLLTFDMLVPAVAGADFYEEYFNGQSSALDRGIQDTLNQALLMYCGGEDTSDCEATSWFNSDMRDRTWDEGIRKLTDGKALMAPMGDWAKGFLESDAGGNLQAGKDYDIAPFPGTQKIFVFTADTFPLPRGAANRDGARSLLKTFASPEGQAAFNLLKGSIPARTDVDLSEFDATSRRIVAAFKESRKLRAISGILSGERQEGLQRELGASLDESRLSLILRYLEANYPLN